MGRVGLFSTHQQVLLKWGRWVQVWRQWLRDREHSPRVCWVFGCATSVRGVSEVLA